MPAGSANTLSDRAYQRVTVNCEAKYLSESPLPLPPPSRFPLAADAALKQQLRMLASSSNVNGGCHCSAIFPQNTACPQTNWAKLFHFHSLPHSG